jgi:hypothetical protein
MASGAGQRLILRSNYGGVAAVFLIKLGDPAHAAFGSTITVPFAERLTTFREAEIQK